jgi:hypothetical protein
MPILLLEAPHFVRGVMALEQKEQAIQGSGPAAASLDRDTEDLVAVMDQRPSHGFGRRDVELDRERLGDAAGGLVEADRSSGGHVENTYSEVVG